MQIIFSHSDSYCVKIQSSQRSNENWLIIGSSIAATHSNGTGRIRIKGTLLAGFQLGELLERTVPPDIWEKTDQVVLACSDSAWPIFTPAYPEGPPPTYHAVRDASPPGMPPSYAYASTNGFTTTANPRPLRPLPSAGQTDRSIAHELSVALGRRIFVRGFIGEVRARDPWEIYASIHHNKPSRAHTFLSKILPIKPHHGGRVKVKTVGADSFGALHAVFYRNGRKLATDSLQGRDGTKIPLSIPDVVRRAYVP